MNEADKKFLERAIECAEESAKADGFPAGAVIVKDGQIIAEGLSLGGKFHDPTEHAETSAIRKACQKLNTANLDGAVMYESLESCLMCFSVAYWAGISKIVYAARKTPEMVSKFYYEGNADTKDINEKNNRKIEIVFVEELEPKSLEVIRRWELERGF